MPFMKNLKDKICLVLEPEVETLLAKGWKVLTEAEEAIHREELRLKPELTSAAAQEEARIKAGLYKVLSGVEAAVESATKAATKKTAAKAAAKGATNVK